MKRVVLIVGQMLGYAGIAIGMTMTILILFSLITDL